MNEVLRICLGAIAAGLAVMGAIGVLNGAMDLIGLRCADEVCPPDGRTFVQHAEATLIALGAFLLGSGVCIRLARDS